MREIEQTRERLTADIQELEDRLPRQARAASAMAGIAVGGGIGGSVIWFAIRRIRAAAQRRRARRMPPPVQAVVQVLPERWGAALQDMRLQPYAYGIGGLYVLMKMAELRRMRTLNRALLRTIEDTD